MAKYKQEYIFGIRAVIEAIQQEKEIDKVMLKQGVRGELFQQLFSLIKQNDIPFQYVPEEVFKPFADRNHQGVLAEVSPVPYQDIDEVLDAVEAKGESAFRDVLEPDYGCPEFRGDSPERGVCRGARYCDPEQTFG